MDRIKAGTILVPSEPSLVLGNKFVESLLIRFPTENLWFTSNYGEDKKIVWDPATLYTHNFIGTISLFLLENHPVDNFAYLPNLNKTRLSENGALQRRIKQTQVDAHILWVPGLDPELVEDLLRRIPR